MDQYLWSPEYKKRSDEAAWREHAWRERKRREAAQLREIVKPGDHLTGFVLATITREIGRWVAKDADDASQPCKVCGLNTYKATVCNDCLDEPYIDLAAQDADAAGYGAL